MESSTIRKRRRAIIARLGGPDIRAGMLIEFPDGFYRLRRGKLVRIPDEWVGRPEEMCGSPKRWREYRLSKRRPSKMGTKKMRRRYALKDYGRVPREKRERKPCGMCSGGYDPGPSRRLGHPRTRSPRHLGARYRRMLDREDGLC